MKKFLKEKFENKAVGVFLSFAMILTLTPVTPAFSQPVSDIANQEDARKPVILYSPDSALDQKTDPVKSSPQASNGMLFMTDSPISAAGDSLAPDAPKPGKGEGEVNLTPEERGKIETLLSEKLKVDRSRINFAVYEAPADGVEGSLRALPRFGLDIQIEDGGHYAAETNSFFLNVWRVDDKGNTYETLERNFNLDFLKPSNESYLNLKHIVEAINQTFRYNDEFVNVEGIDVGKERLDYVDDPRAGVGNSLTDGRIVTSKDGRKFVVVRGGDTFHLDWRKSVEMRVSSVLRIPSQIDEAVLNKLLEKLNSTPAGVQFILSGLKSIKLFIAEEPESCVGADCLVLSHLPQIVVTANDLEGNNREFIGAFGIASFMPAFGPGPVKTVNMNLQEVPAGTYQKGLDTASNLLGQFPDPFESYLTGVSVVDASIPTVRFEFRAGTSDQMISPRLLNPLGRTDMPNTMDFSTVPIAKTNSILPSILYGVANVILNWGENTQDRVQLPVNTQARVQYSGGEIKLVEWFSNENLKQPVMTDSYEKLTDSYSNDRYRIIRKYADQSLNPNGYIITLSNEGVTSIIEKPSGIKSVMVYETLIADCAAPMPGQRSGCLPPVTRLVSMVRTDANGKTLSVTSNPSEFIFKVGLYEGGVLQPAGVYKKLEYQSWPGWEKLLEDIRKLESENTNPSLTDRLIQKELASVDKETREFEVKLKDAQEQLSKIQAEQKAALNKLHADVNLSKDQLLGLIKTLQGFLNTADLTDDLLSQVKNFLRLMDWYLDPKSEVKNQTNQRSGDYPLVLEVQGEETRIGWMGAPWQVTELILGIQQHLSALETYRDQVKNFKGSEEEFKKFIGGNRPQFQPRYFGWDPYPLPQLTIIEKAEEAERLVNESRKVSRQEILAKVDGFISEQVALIIRLKNELAALERSAAADVRKFLNDIKTGKTQLTSLASGLAGYSGKLSADLSGQVEKYLEDMNAFLARVDVDAEIAVKVNFQESVRGVIIILDSHEIFLMELKAFRSKVVAAGEGELESLSKQIPSYLMPDFAVPARVPDPREKMKELKDRGNELLAAAKAEREEFYKLRTDLLKANEDDSNAAKIELRTTNLEYSAAIRAVRAEINAFLQDVRPSISEVNSGLKGLDSLSGAMTEDEKQEADEWNKEITNKDTGLSASINSYTVYLWNKAMAQKKADFDSLRVYISDLSQARGNIGNAKNLDELKAAAGNVSRYRAEVTVSSVQDPRVQIRKWILAIMDLRARIEARNPKKKK